MKEFLMTSAIPYWLLFILAIASVGYCAYILLRGDDDTPVSRNMMIAISATLLIDALAVIALYATLGGNALWWVTGKEISFWNKLLRVIPLVTFLVVQAAAPFVYRLFMESYFHEKSLSVKSQFISLVVIVPVAIIASLFLSETWFYIIAGGGIVIGALYSAYKNISSVGMGSGVIFTVTSFVLCASALVTFLYFIVAFISLIFEMLPVIAIIIGCCLIFGKSFGNAVMRRDNAGNYIANDGSKHSTQSARDSRDRQIYSRRNS